MLGRQPLPDPRLRGGRVLMSGRFEIRATPLAGLKVIERQVIGDNRGYLERLFCADELLPLSSATLQSCRSTTR